MRKFHLRFLLLIGGLSASLAHAENIDDKQILSITDFLNQAREKHDNYKSARTQSEAAQFKINERRIMLAPSLFGSTQYAYDAKPNAFTSYDSVVTKTYQLGLSQISSTGLSGKIYYNVLDASYSNLKINGQLIDAHGVQASPVLELSLPLWRNWMGSETKTQILQGEEQNQQISSSQRFQMKNVLVQSANAYWSLVLARETVRVASDAVKRNEHLLTWHRKRAQDGLGEKSDVLQADAALQLNQINLKNARDAEITAARAFNLARGVESATVTENLMPLTPEYIDKLHPPKRMELREDIKAAASQLKLTDAAAHLNDERYKPTLELFGLAALNNGDPTDGSAIRNSFTTSNPTNMVGLRINMPLAGRLISDVRQGLIKDKLAAEETYQRKTLELNDTWNSLNEKFIQTQERFRLYTDLEKKQKEKFDNEQSRRSAGRTTTQQVLLFENDYETAQLSRIQALYDFFNVYAQMKLFEEVQL